MIIGLVYCWSLFWNFAIKFPLILREQLVQFVSFNQWYFLKHLLEVSLRTVLEYQDNQWSLFLNYNARIKYVFIMKWSIMRFINCSYDIICNKQDATWCGKTKQNNALTQYDDVLHLQIANVKGSFFFFVKLKGLESKRGKIDITCSFFVLPWT